MEKGVWTDEKGASWQELFSAKDDALEASIV